MELFDLEPDAFLSALDELGISGDRRDDLLSQYMDPGRDYERDTRPFLTRLGDNIIGFDDGYETRGEQLGEAAGAFFDMLTEDPLGTAGQMVSGLVDDIGRGVRGELSPTETLGLAPAVSFGSAGLRRAEDLVDAAQRAQAEQFFADNAPVFPGEPFASTPDQEVQFFHPNYAEAMQMLQSPNDMQQRLLDAGDVAEAMRTQGADAFDAAFQTGILSLPRRTFEGAEAAPRQVALVTPDAMVELRPSRANDYGVPRFLDPDLPAGEAYAYVPPAGNPSITHSPHTLATDFPAIDRHEMLHQDLGFGEVPWQETGTSTAYTRPARLDALEALTRRIEEADTPEERDRLIALQQEIRNATPFELYQRNPGEMLARLAEGDPSTARALSLTEALNPYIRPERGFASRAAQAAGQALMSERHGILSLPVEELLESFGRRLPDKYYVDAHVRLPMDLDRAIYHDPTP